MEPAFKTPPRTIMEVYQNLPEGTLAELIDNVIYMSPSPVYNHQKVLLEITTQLKQRLKVTDRVIIAPFDIYLNETSNAVHPDIVVILNGNKGDLIPTGISMEFLMSLLKFYLQGIRNTTSLKRKNYTSALE